MPSLLAGTLLCRWARQVLKRARWVASSVVQCVRRLMGQPLYFSAAHAGMWGERGCGWLHPIHVTQPYHLASMAAWLSSTGISQHSLLPHIPSIHLSAVNSSPCPRIAPHSLNSSSQPLHRLGYACCGKGCLILIPFRLPQMSCFALSHKCFSSDSGSCPNVGIGPCFNSPTPRGQVQFY